MIYPANFENKIGFDQIKRRIEGKCVSSLGMEKCTTMTFSTNYPDITFSLRCVDEFVRLLNEEENFPLDYIYDLRAPLKRIRIEGTFIDETELFELKRTLETIRAVVSFLQREESPYPTLKETTQDVSCFSPIIKLIDKIIDQNGKVKDNASPQLAEIRRELRRAASSISKTLNSILRMAQSEGIVDKDTSPAMRDGRLVIPIAPAYKRKLKGIVHDESATGKTVYIEPAEVVEANNRIRELENDERKEIIKILISAANEIRPEASEMLFSLDFLAQIEFIRAKARFAIEIEAILPTVQNRPLLLLRRAIHPLLFLSIKKQQKTVIPLDLELMDESRILVISGPNAGGKSVCLKTTGLLQYMLQCGLLVPVTEGSEMGIFHNIFIDIGDEQSIENDLSTYSSHLTNMKFFARNANKDTLILIDEFGGGTEPQIGGAIAEALLDKFNQSNVFGVITTHYQNLKHYAEETPGILNGAMLYDRHQMQPLFKLSIGLPGSSFAIEIARKIGLPEEVISHASDIVGQDYINMDKYLQDIVRDKRYWESKRQSVRKLEKLLEEQNEKHLAEMERLRSERREIIQKAKEEATRIIAESNAKVENTIRAIKESQAEKSITRDARKELNKFKEELLVEDSGEEDRIQRKIEKLKQKENKKEKKKPTATTSTPKKLPLTTNDYVRLKGQTSVGRIMELQGKNATIAFGTLKTVVATERVERVDNYQPKQAVAATFVSVQTSDAMYEKKLSFKQEIDLRGMRADEALQAITYFVDDAIQVGVDQVRILHGTGTGALRELTRNYLRSVGGIRIFRDEHIQLGGSGITVVEIE